MTSSMSVVTDHRLVALEAEDDPGLEVVQHLGLGWCRCAVPMSSVHMTITLLFQKI